MLKCRGCLGSCPHPVHHGPRQGQPATFTHGCGHKRQTKGTSSSYHPKASRMVHIIFRDSLDYTKRHINSSVLPSSTDFII